MHARISAIAVIMVAISTRVSFAQSLLPSLVNVAGSSITTSEYLFDLSIGETIISTIVSPAALISQGYLQPDTAFENGVHADGSSRARLHMLPNPVTDHVYITSEEKIGSVTFLDVCGRIAQSSGASRDIVVSQLSNGVYLVRIFDASGNCLDQTKLVKIGK
jgi:hypothetical protein